MKADHEAAKGQPATVEETKAEEGEDGEEDGSIPDGATTAVLFKNWRRPLNVPKVDYKGFGGLTATIAFLSDEYSGCDYCFVA